MRKYKTIFLLIFTALTLAACSSEQGSNWVILTEKQSAEMGIAEWYAEDGQTTGYWRPTREHALAIQEGLPNFLQTNAGSFRAQGTPVWERLEEYQSQYLGITLDGRRIVFANYFCTDAGQNWRKEFILVMDGGKCFFQFMYDADTGEFFHLRVNGDA